MFACGSWFYLEEHYTSTVHTGEKTKTQSPTNHHNFMKYAWHSHKRKRWPSELCLPLPRNKITCASRQSSCCSMAAARKRLGCHQLRRCTCLWRAAATVFERTGGSYDQPLHWAPTAVQDGQPQSYYSVLPACSLQSSTSTLQAANCQQRESLCMLLSLNSLRSNWRGCLWMPHAISRCLKSFNNKAHQSFCSKRRT